MGLAPIALFCYNRLDLLRQTVDALGANKPAVSSNLFIFSDGPKNQDDIAAVNAIREYIRTISGFRSVTIREAETNQGLANSIIAGVTEVVNKYGRIIVLEDDIVTAPYFLQWMNDALNLYENEEKVAGIHAWSPPEQFGKRPETYFIREVGCWGWATWKKGWALFEQDSQKLYDEIIDRKLKKEFDRGGAFPYTKMLKDQTEGKIDSWAIRWYASAFLAEKYTLQSNVMLVENIGFGKGATHCNSNTQKYKIILSEEKVVWGDNAENENANLQKEYMYFLRLNRIDFFTRCILKLKKILQQII